MGTKSNGDNANPANQIISMFQEFFKSTLAGGVLLILFTVAALIWANSSYSETYFALWASKFTIGFEQFYLSKSLLHWINDGLMVIFFFVVGLEIKREILLGELSSFKKAMLPVIGAIGGIIAPGLIYAIVNWGTFEIRGWGIPVATDIAFALGALALLGKGIPTSLRIFLAALAIADDIGAVLIIAIFYTSDLSMPMLAASAGVFALLLAGNFLGIKRISFYIISGVFLWFFMFKSGVHATVAGVLLAGVIPAVGKIGKEEFFRRSSSLFERLNEIRNKQTKYGKATEDELDTVHGIETISKGIQSPLHQLEHSLHYWVTFFIMPVFAFANAGVSLSGMEISSLLHPVSLGIILGLFFGKQIGITVAVWLAVKFKIASLPEKISWTHIYAVSLLCGIGFTMSLFVSSLAFGGSDVETYSKLGILSASFLAGVIGIIVLKITIIKKNASA